MTGVVSEGSIAFHVARLALSEGADVVLTAPAKALKGCARVARRLPGDVDVLEMDVTNDDHLAAVQTELARRWGTVDGALHAIGFAPAQCIGDNFLGADWAAVSEAMHVSAYSLKALAGIVAPLAPPGGSSIVGLDLDASRTYPFYDWMGVAKAALEATTRYLAENLGPRRVRVNLVSSGPLRTVAARGVPGLLDRLVPEWEDRAPLGWTPNDLEPVARTCVSLLSDWLPMTTGAIIPADGGFHAVAVSTGRRATPAIAAR